MSKVLIGVIAAVVLGGLVYFLVTENSKISVAPATSQKTQTTPSKAAPTDTPIVVSRPAETVTSNIQGVITEVTDDSLKVQADGKVRAYGITQTKDYQRITSGSIGKSEIKTVTAAKTDLKAGQEVYLIFGINGLKARSVYIVK